jgi:hypothetical protein
MDTEPDDGEDDPDQWRNRPQYPDKWLEPVV